MSTAPGHDLSDLVRWTSRDERQHRLDAVMAEHFEPAMQKFGLAFKPIDDALGDSCSPAVWALTQLHGRAAELAYGPL